MISRICMRSAEAKFVQPRRHFTIYNYNYTLDNTRLSRTPNRGASARQGRPYPIQRHFLEVERLGVGRESDRSAGSA